MQIIAWLIKILIFIALLGFALGNTEVVHLGVFGKQEVGFDAPLVVFLLGFVHVGTAAAPAKGRERPDPSGFVRAWHGPEC